MFDSGVAPAQPAGTTHLPEVGSTNDWLLTRADTLADGHWVVADRQTAGRGRRGRAWSDGVGNLMASVLVRASGPVQQLSFVAAVALADAVAGCIPAADRTMWLKWPNDLMLADAKLAGILLERAGDHLVIGFGVNLATHPEQAERPATSLAATGLPAPAPGDVLARLRPAFAAARQDWAAHGFAPIRRRWLARARGLGGRVTARLGHETLEGRFDGLDEAGALLLRLDDGSLRTIHAGEVFAL